MVVPVLSRGARFVVVLAVATALLMSGCVAKKDDPEVLREGARSSETADGDVFSISVPKGVERLVITIDTRAEPEDSGIPNCSWCFMPGQGQESGDEPQGHIRVLIDPPDDARQQDDAMFSMGHDKVDRTTFDAPAAGMWEVFLSYEEGYNGPAYLRAESTGSASSARPFITDNMLEITGLVLTIGAIVTGAVLYRRRGNFLRRELHKIDATVHLFKDDVDECRTNLHELHEHLKELLVRRKIEDSHYLILEKRIERYLADLDTPGNRHAAAATAAPATRKPRIIEEPSDWEPL